MFCAVHFKERSDYKMPPQRVREVNERGAVGFEPRAAGSEEVEYIFRIHENHRPIRRQHVRPLRSETYPWNGRGT